MTDKIVIKGQEGFGTIADSMRRWMNAVIPTKVDYTPWTKEQFLEDMRPHISPNRLEELRTQLPDGIHLWPMSVDSHTELKAVVSNDSLVEFTVEFALEKKA